MHNSVKHTFFYVCTSCGCKTRYDYETHPYFEIPYGKTFADRVYQSDSVPEQYRMAINVRYEDSVMITAQEDEKRVCNQCGAVPRMIKKTALRRVKISDKHQCDSRCTNAVSDTCECSCGGENHGRDHLRRKASSLFSI